jgi:hypothetical protein
MVLQPGSSNCLTPLIHLQLPLFFLKFTISCSRLNLPMTRYHQECDRMSIQMYILRRTGIRTFSEAVMALVLGASTDLVHDAA